MFQNRKITPLVLLFVLLIVALSIIVLRPQSPAVQNSAPVNSSSTPVTSLGTKTDSQAEVTVLVTPIVLKAGEPPRFEVALNTHSVDLGFNVADIANLTDDRGQSISGPKWVGSPPGGHHRSGELDFNQALNRNTKRVTLTLKNIAGVPSRVFTWNLP